MKLIWDSEENQYIESWMFEEWFLNQLNRPSNQTLEQLKLFQWQ